MAPVGGPIKAAHTVIWLRVPSGQSTRLLIKPLGRAHAASMGGGVNVWEQWSIPVFLILIVSISRCSRRGANLLLSHLRSRVQAYVPSHILIMCQPSQGNLLCSLAPGGASAPLHKSRYWSLLQALVDLIRKSSCPGCYVRFDLIWWFNQLNNLHLHSWLYMMNCVWCPTRTVSSESILTLLHFYKILTLN